MHVGQSGGVGKGAGDESGEEGMSWWVLSAGGGSLTVLMGPSSSDSSAGVSNMVLGQAQASSQKDGAHTMVTL